MFHPGKVIAVLKNDGKNTIGADKSVQVLVSMWDDNLLTLDVEAPLWGKIRVQDLVLVDYSPKYPTLPVPRQVVVKILRNEAGKKIWSEYTGKHRKRQKPPVMVEPLPESNMHVR